MQTLTALLLTALTACAGAQGISGTGPRTTAEPTSAPTGSPAVSVTYEKSGGVAGIYESNQYAPDAPPPDGLGRAAVKAVLRAASDPALRTLEMTPLPEDQCCDRFSYVVTITWEDGVSRTYKSLDGVEQPPAFDRFLHHLL